MGRGWVARPGDLTETRKPVRPGESFSPAKFPGSGVGAGGREPGGSRAENLQRQLSGQSTGVSLRSQSRDGPQDRSGWGSRPGTRWGDG